ncbi:hypothetical protein FQA39_LY18003 [Lamprigera yunnana]|nr:hypothetical protein FQA39_LY18003 [Lamprigera yunnana]
MDINSTESCTIKSEIILTETFCGSYEDCGNEELKKEPVDYKELIKCKEEDDPAEHMDTSAAPVQKCSGIHLKTIKNVEYVCKQCNFKTHLECFIKKHLKVHKGVDNTYITKERNFKTPQSFSTAPHVKTSRSDEYICNECNYKTSAKHSLKEHVKIHTGEEYKCNECDYKTVWKQSVKEHVKIHTGEEYKCKEYDYKTVWKQSVKEHVKIHTGEEYKCNECDYKTVRKSRLKEHVKIHTGEEYKCKDCDYKTVWKQSVKEHVKIHTGEEYKCKECDYKTVWKQSVKKHLKIHTGEEYKCKECDYKTVWQQSLKEHVKIHTGDEYKCEECDYKTVWKKLLKQHVIIHKGVYTCNKCDYKTVWKSKPKEHGKIHTGEEYKCKECDYKTSRKHSLKEHVKIHTGEEYKCKECDYKTVRKSRLKEHVKIHTGEEYKCNECDYKTSRKHSLKEHVKIHTGEQYKCNECGYKTVRKHSLKEHVKIHTGEEYKCNECNYKTSAKHSLKEHVKIHTNEEYKCNECDYKTVWKQSVKEHVKIHTGEEYKCNECNYKTSAKHSLKEHVKIHTGEEYKCNECDYKTVWKQSVKEHVKIHTGEEYKCNECDYKTSAKHSLKEHVKIHTGEEYKCKDCDYKTVWKQSVKEHVKIHTGEEYKCKDCDYKTVWKQSVKEHVKIHTGDEYKCKEYKTEYSQFAKFMGHTEKTHQEYYEITQDAFQTAKVAKLLTLFDKGKGTEYRNKTLDNINIDPNNEIAECDDNADNHGEPTASPRYNSISHDKDEGNVADNAVVSRKNKKSNRIRWTAEQKKLVSSHFKKHIKLKQAQKKNECEEFRSQHKHILGALDWVRIKTFVYNEYKDTNKNKKQIATLMQIINLDKTEYSQFAKFMGHTEKTHQEYYEITQDAFQTAKVAKLLTLFDKGKGTEYRNKTLDNINIDPNNEIAECDDNADNHGEPTASPRYNSISHDKDEGNVADNAVVSRKNKKSNRIRWTAEQKKLVSSHFKKHIKLKQAQKKNECEEFRSQHKHILGALDWVRIKTFVYNEYKDTNKNKRTFIIVFPLEKLQSWTELFSTLWKMQIIDMIIVTYNSYDDLVSVFTSDPYHESNKCGQIADFMQEHKCENVRTIENRRILKKYNFCNLTQYHSNIENDYKIDTPANFIVKTTCAALNLTLIFKYIKTASESDGFFVGEDHFTNSEMQDRSITPIADYVYDLLKKDTYDTYAAFATPDMILTLTKVRGLKLHFLLTTH